MAVTRAKRRLVTTGAFWYGQKTPKRPSELYSIVDGLEISSRLVDCEEPGPQPAAPALYETTLAPDPHFGEGWQSALMETMRDPAWSRRAAGDKAAYDGHVDQLSLMLGRLPKREDATPESTAPISVSSLVTYAACPKRYYWTDVDKLPRRPARWLQAGVDLHRRIELHNRGVIPLEVADEEAYDFVPDEQGPRSDAFETFQESRFAAVKPTWVETPFVLQLGDNRRVRGRIDAIYTEGESWEVVDFKSGRKKSDPARQVQLQAYGVAVDEGSLGSRPGSLSVTFAYFGDGLEEETAQADAAWLEQARARLGSILDGISDERFEPEPSAACRHCDFVKFCEPGQQWLTENQDKS